MPILIYEFASNGPCSSNYSLWPIPLVPWIDRLRIDAGTANMLACLHFHFSTSMSVIHRNEGRLQTCRTRPAGPSGGCGEQAQRLWRNRRPGSCLSIRGEDRAHHAKPRVGSLEQAQ